MKRLLTSAAMFLCSLLTFADGFSGSGSGTENDPYLILNPIHLNQLRNFLNQEGIYFKLMASFDLTEYLEDESPSQGWQPVGTSSTPFKGVLDGNGKTISGFWIDRSNTDYVGFFGNLTGGTVKNLTIKGNSVKGKDYVGFLAGIGGIVDNCIFDGSVMGSSYVGGCCGSYGTFNNVSSTVNVNGGDYTGGLVGRYGKFTRCHITCTFVNGVNYVGGISGSTDLNIEKSYVYTSVSGNDYIGGVCGQAKNGKESIIKDCGFLGDVTGHSYIGGLCGECSGAESISECFAVGQVLANGNYVGGLFGYSTYCNYGYSGYRFSNLKSSYFSGSVAGNEQVGGLIGYKSGLNSYQSPGRVNSCYANATVKGVKTVGGLFGKIEHVVVESNIAILTSVKATENQVGRIYGERNGGSVGEMGTAKENKAFNRAIVINAGVAQDITDDEQNGTGVSKTTLKLKATYVAVGWDFTDVWEIQESECYPYMKSQTAPPVITSQVVSGATTISGKCVDGGTVTLEIDGVRQQQVSSGHEFSFTVSPLQAGHEVRISAKAEGKEQSYYTTETVAYLGSGKENDPYQVYTASDLTGVYRKGYFKLMNDIDLTDYINQFSPTEGWESIGREGSETIHFDGNGKKITGLWCNSTRDNTGLFSCFANGTIKNLTVEVASGKQVKGGANTGILIGKMINGTIENCKVSGKVADRTPVGGMVGLMDGGKISICQTNVTINTTGNTSYVGGLVGEITGGEIDQCVTLGTLTATGTESYVGGMVGKNYATVTNCYSNANVTSSYNAAGLIAYNYGLVEKCYATGNLSSNNYAAGVIGYNDGENAVIKNCAAMNNKIDLTFESQSAQSGGYGQRIIGGIKNGAPAPELNNYALKTMQVSLNNKPQPVSDDIMNGVGKPGADLTKASTYQELGWNFTNTWTIVEGESYPSLKNNAANVMKPGEDLNPNPDPEPVVTDKDKLEVGNVMASKGNTASIGINLINESTDLTAYQFDLILPAGVTLATNDKGKYLVTKTSRYDDDNQTLNVSKVEGSDNTYRIVCFSMSNDKITGTSGAILNAVLAIDANIVDGTYEGKITNIVFTKTDGAQEKLNDTKFNVVVSSVIPGDANGDGEVNVSDIVEIVNYIMGKPSSKFIFAAADFNNDSEVNVTDIVKVVSVIMSTNNAPMRASAFEMDNNDQLTIITNSEKAFSLCLDNDAQYVAAQFDIKLAEGMTLESIGMNGERQDNHLMTYARTGDNLYKVVVYSSENRPFKGNSGELLSFKVTGIGNVEVSNILFVTSRETETTFPALLGGTTGIDNVKTSEAMDVYSLDGRLVRKHVMNTDGLEKGLYIINGKKHIVR